MSNFLGQFFSVKLFHLWSCQTLQEEKISKNFYDAGTIAFHYVVLNYLYSGFVLSTNCSMKLLELNLKLNKNGNTKAATTTYILFTTRIWLMFIKNHLPSMYLPFFLHFECNWINHLWVVMQKGTNVSIFNVGILAEGHDKKL